MNISNAVIEEIRDRIYDQLATYQNQMEIAYNLCGDDPLTVKLDAKIAPDNGKKKITTSISFVKDRCRDSGTSYVDDEQIGLFDEQREE